MQIAEETDSDMDKVHGGRTQMVLLKVRVCLLSCAEELCLKNINVAQLKIKIRLFGLLSTPNDNNS